MRDFSKYQKNDKNYTGSEEKFGVTINNEDYIIKFRKSSETGLLNNHISEHIGSNIFNLLGEEAQITMLGLYDGREVVLCKDFNKEEESFTPFNDVGESSLERDRELYQYSYEDIIRMLEENKKNTCIEQTIEKFWNMFIIDAFIGNFDRHGANWGFIKKDNKYRFAPIFDNGSSLFPRRNNDELLKEVLTSEEKLKEITYRYPTSQIKLNNKKSSYYEVINSLQFQECNNALKRIYYRIDMDKIKQFIESLTMISNLQKEFYIKVLEYRYENIIKNPYQKLVGENNE
ncbi:MAG: CtkA family protein [Crenarchaeota archaeon]|nr:CtkA family protein [Thermoproteota archaeon]